MPLAVEVFKPNLLISQADHFDQLFSRKGQEVSRDLISEMRLIQTEACQYYLKLYYHGGKHLRRFLGKSRCRRERDNLLYFKRLGIPVPTLVAFGERRRLTRQACLITEALENTESLLTLHQSRSPLLQNSAIKDYLITQIAEYTERLHRNRFVHIDLKWRNILVNTQTLKVYFIDCPQGHRVRFLLERGIVKDLACLDKVGRYALSKTERLRFYMRYSGITRLTKFDKKRIKRILLFFKGRE